MSIWIENTMHHVELGDGWHQVFVTLQIHYSWDIVTILLTLEFQQVKGENLGVNLSSGDFSNTQVKLGARIKGENTGITCVMSDQFFFCVCVCVCVCV